MTREDLAGRHWVLIETGGNQRYVFASNRRRQNIGASQLVTNVGTTWLTQALGDHAAALGSGHGQDACATVVVASSGKAELLVTDPACGRDLVARVTGAAVAGAPGLGVWGAVDTEPVSGDPHTGTYPCACAGCRLRAVHHQFAAARIDSPHQATRFPSTPFTETCAHTGLPATDLRAPSHQPRQPVSAAYTAAFDAGPAAMAELRGRVEDDSAAGRAAAGSIPGHLNVTDPGQDPVLNDGWIALLHADGNGVGNLFVQLGRSGADGLTGLLSGLASGLDTVMRESVRAAAAHVRHTYPLPAAAPGDEPRPRDGWLLPIVLGGDDLTVLLDGRIAMAFTTRLVQEFASRAEEDPGITAAQQALRVQQSDAVSPGQRTADVPVSLSAGLVFVKPHHPFSDAYDLSEQLCASAKSLATSTVEGCGTVDFHVLYDSLGRDLAGIRQDRRSRDTDEQPLRLWCGPLVVPATDDTTDMPATTTLLAQAVEALRRADNRADDAVPGSLSRSSAHGLRSGLTVGGAALAREAERAYLRAADPDAARQALDRFLVVGDPLDPAARMTFLLDALALAEVEGSQR